MKTCNRLILASLLLTALLNSNSSFAWGPTGHRAVGELAEQNLDRKARKLVEELLDGKSLAQVSNWPDEIKSEPTTYGHTYGWHYTDWSDDHQDHDETNSSGKLITALNDNLKILSDKKQSKENRATALKWMVHLVGDLHMPLHVGNGIDRGGNNCRVFYHGTASNLHKVWDDDMIAFWKLSFTEIVKFISVGTKDDVKAIQNGTFLDWAKESKTLRSQIYPDEVQTDAQPMSQKNYCNKDIAIPDTALPKLGYEYNYKFMPTLERRLRQAGLRLAWILNKI